MLLLLLFLLLLLHLFMSVTASVGNYLQLQKLVTLTTYDCDSKCLRLWLLRNTTSATYGFNCNSYFYPKLLAFATMQLWLKLATVITCDCYCDSLEMRLWLHLTVSACNYKCNCDHLWLLLPIQLLLILPLLSLLLLLKLLNTTATATTTATTATIEPNQNILSASTLSY